MNFEGSSVASKIMLVVLTGLVLGVANASDSSPAPVPFEITSGWLSKSADITLASLDTMCGLSPNTIKKYAYSYQDESCKDFVGDDLVAGFKKYGGFVYFDQDDKLVCKTSFGPESSDNTVVELKFSGKVEQVTPTCSPFAPITLKPLADAGATEYCWEPNATSGEKGFHYKFANNEYHYYQFMPANHTVAAFPDGLGPFYLHKIDVSTPRVCKTGSSVLQSAEELHDDHTSKKAAQKERHGTTIKRHVPDGFLATSMMELAQTAAVQERTEVIHGGTRTSAHSDL